MQFPKGWYMPNHHPGFYPKLLVLVSTITFRRRLASIRQGFVGIQQFGETCIHKGAPRTEYIIIIPSVIIFPLTIFSPLFMSN